MIIDGGVCKVGIESTVIDLTTKPKILREGGLSSEVIGQHASCDLGKGFTSATFQVESLLIKDCWSGSKVLLADL